MGVADTQVQKRSHFMLSLFSNGTGGRRSFLRAGSLGLGGLSLSQLLAASSNAHAADAELLKGRSVIFLFLHGGPSQTETFDPKMTAPPGIRSVNGEIKTSIPGVTFGSSFPKLAKLADKFSVVRSFRTGDGIHDIKPIVSRHSADANLGSLYARIAGLTNERTGMPTNVAVFPRAVEAASQVETNAFGKFASGGVIGPAFAPFVLGNGDLQNDMKLNIDQRRLDDRRGLLAQLDRGKQQLEHAATNNVIDRYREQAFDTIIGGVADAFDLSKEDPRVVAAYDTAPLVRPDQISRKWNNYNNYVDNANTLGKLLLLARRLCERGCGFVTVTTNFVWDMHSDVNNAGVAEGMEYMGKPLDHAVATFINDLEAKGLQDKILLVACGEMGRTPKINAKGGRDHWGRIAPLLMYGGGLKMGQVVGQSNKDASEPATHPYEIGNLISTIMHSLVDVSEVRLMRNLPAEVMRIATGSEPIRELV